MLFDKVVLKKKLMINNKSLLLLYNAFVSPSIDPVACSNVLN